MLSLQQQRRGPENLVEVWMRRDWKLLCSATGCFNEHLTCTGNYCAIFKGLNHTTALFFPPFSCFVLLVLLHFVFRTTYCLNMASTVPPKTYVWTHCFTIMIKCWMVFKEMEFVVHWNIDFVFLLRLQTECRRWPFFSINGYSIVTRLYECIRLQNWLTNKPQPWTNRIIIVYKVRIIFFQFHISDRPIASLKSTIYSPTSSRSV